MKNRWKPHVTVAAVIHQDGKFLLVEEETADGLRLNNPAGHLEFGESLTQACARETLEETAHPFVPTDLIGIYLSPQERATESDLTYLRFAFSGSLGERDPTRTLDEGIVRTLWMSAQEIRASARRHRSSLVIQCMEDFLAGQRYPIELIHSDLKIVGA
jgi:ADP-ribose pyrophosphatase YjhB (NUDIX family)